MPISILENELPGFGPVGVTEESGNRTVRRSKALYSHRELSEIKKRILGYTTLREDGGLLRYLPWRDPISREQLAVRVDHQGVGYKSRDADNDNDVPMVTTYRPIQWNVTTHFSTLPYPVGTGTSLDGETIVGDDYDADETERYCTKVCNVGREWINPPKGNFYDANGQLIPIPIPTMLPYQDLEVTWYQIPVSTVAEFCASPVTAITECTGVINSLSVDLPILPDGMATYPAQTLHLYAVRPQLVYQSDGSYAVNLTYGLRYRGGLDRLGNPITWNTFPLPNGSFGPFYRDKAHTIPFFDTKNFRNLFRTEFLYDADS